MSEVNFTTQRADCQTPIYVQGKAVGHVQGGAFVKHVRGSVHMLRKPPAWALDVQSLADAEAAGAKQVAIHDTESGQVYRASVALIRAKGFTFDRGFGRQIALPLDLWNVERPSETRAVQLALFGV